MESDPFTTAAQLMDGKDDPSFGIQTKNDPVVVERNVKRLLNRLSSKNFEEVWPLILSWVNRAEQETNSRTVIQVIRLIFEKATLVPSWTQVGAALCRNIMEGISPKVQDILILDDMGRPVSSGRLFRKLLLNRCQEAFERGWSWNEALPMLSEEYYSALKTKHQGLGVIKFIGELFKLRMLKERIMHECVQKLLDNLNPREEDIESLHMLLTTVGSLLDTPRARAHFDIYFSRMEEIRKDSNITSRTRIMLQDLIELRNRKWVAHTTPTTQIHAVKERVVKGSEPFQHPINISSNGSRYSGLAVASNSAPRAPLTLANWEITQPRPMPPFGEVTDKKWDGGSQTLFRRVSSLYTIPVQPSKSEYSSELAAKAIESPHRRHAAASNISQADVQTTDQGWQQPLPVHRADLSIWEKILFFIFYGYLFKWLLDWLRSPAE